VGRWRMNAQLEFMMDIVRLVISKINHLIKQPLPHKEFLNQLFKVLLKLQLYSQCAYRFHLSRQHNQLIHMVTNRVSQQRHLLRVELRYNSQYIDLLLGGLLMHLNFMGPLIIIWDRLIINHILIDEQFSRLKKCIQKYHNKCFLYFWLH